MRIKNRQNLFLTLGPHEEQIHAHAHTSKFPPCNFTLHLFLQPHLQMKVPQMSHSYTFPHIDVFIKGSLVN